MSATRPVAATRVSVIRRAPPGQIHRIVSIRRCAFECCLQCTFLQLQLIRLEIDNFTWLYFEGFGKISRGIPG